MNPSDTDEMVLLPVPRQYYREVVSHLAHLMAAEPSAEPTSASIWTVEQIGRLARQPLNPTIRAMLELVAGAPDTRFCLADVQSRAGTDYGQARAHLAAFTKLLRKHFDREDWPIRVEQGPDGKLYYHASPYFAECWTKTSSTAHPSHPKGKQP
jgi:hypothetical protein